MAKSQKMIMSKAKKHIDFQDYIYGYEYGFGVVCFTEDETLDLKERLKYSHRPQASCFLYAQKVKEGAKLTAKRRKACKLTKQQEMPEFEFIEPWFKSFKKNKLETLLTRYYTPDAEKICIAISPDNKDNLRLHAFLLPEHLIIDLPDKFNRAQANIGVNQYFAGFRDAVKSEYDNQIYISKKGLLEFIKYMRKIVEHFEFDKKIDKADCDQLYCSLNLLTAHEDIIADFMREMHKSLVDDLITKKQIIRCKYCGRFALYFRTKKFCSLSVDGRNCGHRAASQRDYKKFKRKRLKTKRDWMRRTRKEIPDYDKAP